MCIIWTQFEFLAVTPLNLYQISDQMQVCKIDKDRLVKFDLCSITKTGKVQQTNTKARANMLLPGLFMSFLGSLLKFYPISATSLFIYRQPR